jgi:putative flippase GtrA
MPKKKPRPLFAVVRHLYKKRSFRYLAVGGTVYLLELVVIVVAQRWWGATPTEAVALSFLIGLFVSFFLQKLFAFRDRRMHHRVVLSQAIAVGLLVLFNLGFTLAVTRLLQSWFDPTITRTIALLITTIWNFYLYKTRIFNPQTERKVPTEHPSILLRFDMKRSSVHAAELTAPQETVHDDRQHSWRVVLLCLLVLLALVTGGWVVSTLQHTIAHGASKKEVAARS